MDQPIAHHSSRPGVVTRSQILNGGNVEIDNTSASLISRRSFGSLYQRCQSDSALNESDGKNMHIQN